MTNFQIVLCLGAAFALFMYYMDRRRWARFPREELVRGASGENRLLWKPYLVELRRRGEDIGPFMPWLLRALMADTALKRMNAKLVLCDLYPDIKPVLKDFSPTADLATRRAQVEPLLSLFGMDAEGNQVTDSPLLRGSRGEVQSYLTPTAKSSDELLADWRWLIGPDLQLWHATKMGDAFLRDPADGSVHFLDTISAVVNRLADDETGFEKVIANEVNANRLLMRQIVDMQAALGMRPGPDQCLSLKTPPVLGGQLHPDNFDVVSLIVHLSFAGQIHQQVKDLPEGTPISSIELKAPDGGESAHV